MMEMETKATYWKVSYQPAVRYKDVAKIKLNASRWAKFKLLFKRTKYSFDNGYTIPYKDMGNIRYVLKRKIHPQRKNK